MAEVANDNRKRGLALAVCASLVALALIAFVLARLVGWLTPASTEEPTSAIARTQTTKSSRPALRPARLPVGVDAGVSNLPADHPFANIRITGRVTDADTGAGVPGAMITLRSAFGETHLGPAGGDGSVQATTAGDGTYALIGVPPGNFELDTHASGYLPETMRFRKFSEVEHDDGFDFALEPAGIIEGRVLDGSGNGLGGATVVALEPGTNFVGESAVRSISAEDGRFVLDPVSSGALRLLATHADAAASSVDIEAGDLPLRRVDIRMAAGQIVRGTVSDVDGPVAGASVGLRALRVPGDELLMMRPVLSTRLTDAEGHFELRAPVGAGIELRASADGYQGRTARARVGDEPVVLSMQLQRGEKLAGIVTAADGRPAVGAHIMVAARGGGSGRTQTDRTGAFVIHGLPPTGPYMLIVRHYAHPPLEVEEETVGEGRVYRLEAAARILGRVFDQETQVPITEYGYELDGPVRSHNRGFSASGAFEIPSLPPGTYELRVFAKGYGRAVRGNLVVSVGRDVAGVDIGLSRAGGISGVLRGMDEGAVLVQVRSASGGDDADLERETLSRPDGTFEISPLPAGTYHLVARQLTRRGTASNIVVEPGQETTGVDVVLSLD